MFLFSYCDQIWFWAQSDHIKRHLLFLLILGDDLKRHLLFYLILGEDQQRWKPDDGGWPLHVTSSISDLLISLSFIIFILTFTPGFKNFKIDSVKMIMNEEQNSLPIRRPSHWNDEAYYNM
jgi:hypothetical protein